MQKKNKWKIINIKIYCYLFLNYLIYVTFKRQLNKEDYFFPLFEKENMSLVKSKLLKYPKLSDLKLNYFGNCGEVFKYKKNNKRDLVMFTYRPSRFDFYSNRSLLIYIVIDSIKKNIPKAKIICFMPNNSGVSFVNKILEKNKILIIKKDFLKIQLVSRRFLLEYEYLKNNINSYDRIIHADLIDVFFLSDIFQTLNPNEIIINKECGEYSAFGAKGNFIFRHPNDIRWFNRSFGDNKTLEKILKRINPMVINAGLIMGGSKEYLKFLDIMLSNLNYTKALDYGYDQMLINVLYYTGKFNSVNIKFDLCTQRSCFIPILIFNRKNKSLNYRNGCSPVLIHKAYPIYY